MLIESMYWETIWFYYMSPTRHSIYPNLDLFDFKLQRFLFRPIQRSASGFPDSNITNWNLGRFKPFYVKSTQRVFLHIWKRKRSQWITAGVKHIIITITIILPRRDRRQQKLKQAEHHKRKNTNSPETILSYYILPLGWFRTLNRLTSPHRRLLILSIAADTVSSQFQILDSRN